MSKAVMMSIQPKWCELIANGQKTIEVRKTKPKLETPFKCYIYCTKPKMRLVDIIRDGEDVYGEIYHGKTRFIKAAESSTYGTMCRKYQKVIGEFVCDKVFDIYKFSGSRFWLNETLVKATCLTEKEINDYGKGKDIFGWHISDLVIYDKPKELCEFGTPMEIGKYTYKPVATLKRPPQSWCYVEESK